MPSTVTLATSAPRPPVGPPPAAGAAASFVVDFAGAFAAAALGVATFGVFFGAVFVFSALMRDASGVSRATGAGFSAAGFAAAGGVSTFGVGCTSPIWRGPGGAATRFTRYVGGIATG